MMRVTSFDLTPLMINGLLSGFKKLGYETNHFPFRDWPHLSRDEGVEYLSKDLNDTKPDYFIYAGYAPDYCDYISRLCKEKGIGFIYWAVEDPIGFNDTLFMAKAADYVFTTSIECIPMYKKHNINAHLLTFACNPDYHKTGKFNTKYDIDIAMTAGYYIWNTRKKGYQTVLKPAIDSGYSFRLWGAGWNCTGGKETLKDMSLYHGYFPNEEMPDLCASAKIILGVQCDDSSITQTSMRPYEVLGCRSFHLTQWTKATAAIFKEGVHLVTSNSKEETLEKIKYYINHPEERAKIARQGQEYVYKYHTYEQRVRENIVPFF